MPKKQNLDATFMEWAEGVPQEIVDKFLSSASAEKIANLHGGMTKAQQEAKAARDQAAQEMETVSKLRTWAAQHSDLYDRMPEWAPIIRAHQVEEVDRALSGAKRDVEQQAANVESALRQGTLTPEEALPIVVDMQKRYGAINEQVEEMKKFREHEVPRLVGAVEENFKQFNNRMDGNTRAMLEYNTNLIKYSLKHPERDPEKITKTFIERNKERQYKTFDDVAADAYGEDDTEQLIEQRTAERIAAQQQKTRESGQTEAPITGSAIGPFRRQHAPVAPPPATDASQVRSRLLEHFEKQR